MTVEGGKGGLLYRRERAYRITKKAEANRQDGKEDAPEEG